MINYANTFALQQMRIHQNTTLSLSHPLSSDDISPLSINHLIHLTVLNLLCIIETHPVPDVSCTVATASNNQNELASKLSSIPSSKQAPVQAQQSSPFLTIPLNNPQPSLPLPLSPQQQSTKFEPKSDVLFHTFIHLYSTQILSFVGHFPLHAVPYAVCADSHATRLLCIYNSDSLLLDRFTMRLRMELWDISRIPKEMQLIRRWDSAPPPIPPQMSPKRTQQTLAATQTASGKETEKSSRLHLRAPSFRRERSTSVTSFTDANANANASQHSPSASAAPSGTTTPTGEQTSARSNANKQAQTPPPDPFANEVFFEDPLIAASVVVFEKYDVFAVSDTGGHIYLIDSANGELISDVGDEAAKHWDESRFISPQTVTFTSLRNEWKQRQQVFSSFCGADSQINLLPSNPVSPSANTLSSTPSNNASSMPASRLSQLSSQSIQVPPLPV